MVVRSIARSDLINRPICLALCFRVTSRFCHHACARRNVCTKRIMQLACWAVRQRCLAIEHLKILHRCCLFVSFRLSVGVSPRGSGAIRPTKAWKHSHSTHCKPGPAGHLRKFSLHYHFMFRALDVVGGKRVQMSCVRFSQMRPVKLLVKTARMVSVVWAVGGEGLSSSGRLDLFWLVLLYYIFNVHFG